MYNNYYITYFKLFIADYYNESKDIVRENFIIQSQTAVDLICGNLSNDHSDKEEVGVGWTKLEQEGTLIPLDMSNSSDTSVRVKITTAKDQAKYICHDAERVTVFAIQYISIKGI